MPCIEGTPQNIDVALQILDAVTPRNNFGGETDSAVIREITQTDHLNKLLVKTFLERLNLDAGLPNNVEEDDSFQDFDD